MVGCIKRNLDTKGKQKDFDPIKTQNQLKRYIVIYKSSYAMAVTNKSTRKHSNFGILGLKKLKGMNSWRLLHFKCANFKIWLVYYFVVLGELLHVSNPNKRIIKNVVIQGKHLNVYSQINCHIIYAEIDVAINIEISVSSKHTWQVFIRENPTSTWHAQ